MRNILCGESSFSLVFSGVANTQLFLRGLTVDPDELLLHFMRVDTCSVLSWKDIYMIEILRVIITIERITAWTV